MWRVEEKKKHPYYQLDVAEANIVDKLTSMVKIEWLYCGTDCYLYDLNDGEYKILTGKEFSDALHTLDDAVACAGGIRVIGVSPEEQETYISLMVKVAMMESLERKILKEKYIGDKELGIE